MSRLATTRSKEKMDEASKGPSDRTLALKIPVQVTPVFESSSSNILEIAEKGFQGNSLSLGPNGILIEMPPNSALPALVRVEFKLKKAGTVSVYAKWNRQGHLFNFEFLIITTDDQARVRSFLQNGK